MSAAIKRTRVVIGLGSAQTLAFGSTYYLPAILAEPIAREFGVSNGVVFTAFSGALIMAAVLGPLVGRRIDLFGGRDVLTVSSLVFAVGLATLGAAQETVTLFAGWLVIGIGMAMGLYGQRSPRSLASTVERRAARSPASRCWQVWRAQSVGRSPPTWRPSLAGEWHASSGPARTSSLASLSTASSSR
jgi:MFS family permease